MNSLKNFLIPVIFLASTLTGLDSQVVKKDFFQTTTNWTDYTITVESKETLPRIQTDTIDSEHFTDTATNLSEARNISYQRAKSSNRSKMNLAIERILLDENYNLGEYINENPSLREKIIEYFNELPEVESKKLEKNKMILTSSIDILGTNNLISKFYLEIGGSDIPVLVDHLPSEEYSGIVIDARGTKFTPSLFPKIQTEYGTDIFNRKIANPSSVQEFGMVSYLNNPKSQELNKRVGKNPYWVVPVSIVGKNKTNLVISYEEAKKILASPVSRKNIHLCKVVILVN
jgi:hypothetical protein